MSDEFTVDEIREAVTLAPGASEAFEATVAVPEDADHGFHQGAVRVTSRVVDGRYRSGRGFTSYQEITEVMDHVIDKVLLPGTRPACH